MVEDLKNYVSRITLNDVVLFCGTSLLMYVAAKFGQYLFYGYMTSPAILWPPTGIALAIIWLGGYRYAVPIFLGLFASSLTGPLAHLIPAVLTTPLAQVGGHMAGVYLLRRFNFDGTFGSVRNVLLFLLTIFLCCMIAPTITTGISALTGTLTITTYFSWSRAWAGYIFSCLILTPLILSWTTPQRSPTKSSPLESGFVALILTISVYFLFWTHNASEFAFLYFALFFIAHFWVSFRFNTKLVTLSMFATTVMGILGLFLSPNPERALNEQLFATELFLFLVVPIFYAFSALVKDRARTIRDLKNAMKSIEEENIVKNNFIAVLAHELRNPLAPVKTTLEILAQLQHDAETHKLIKSAQHQVHSMRRMLDDLLDMTRVTQGKFQLQIERSSLQEMLEHSLTLTKTLFSDRGHEFILKPLQSDVWLQVDPVRFEQAVVNVLNNAAKYTPEGGHIGIETIRKKDAIEIRVTDNGVGIAPENLDHIFESFWQVRNNAFSSGAGIGVGLALTKHIIELHGGTISAQSTGVGKGSTFVIKFPYHEESIRFSEYKGKEMKIIFPRKILVVDDNHAAADSMCKLLTLKGHEASATYSGTSAIQIVRDLEPDIVLLDIGLPDIGGYDVAMKLRENGYKNKIVALSGYGQQEDKERAYAAGCDHHFTKPMAIDRFESYLLTL